MQIRIAAMSLVFAIVLLVGAPLPRAADIAVPAPIADADPLRGDLEAYAALYLLRAMFDVVEPDTVPRLLHQAAKSLTTGDRDALEADLKESLSAEGSYYIVSLTYLVSVGGANWPQTRPPETYDRDALKLLEGLRHDWLVAVETTGDLMPILNELDRINAQTEGYDELPVTLDHFSGLAALVDDALADLGTAPSTRTEASAGA